MELLRICGGHRFLCSRHEISSVDRNGAGLNEAPFLAGLGMPGVERGAEWLQEIVTLPQRTINCAV
jgi:hypothetical protein